MGIYFANDFQVDLVVGACLFARALRENLIRDPVVFWEANFFLFVVVSVLRFLLLVIEWDEFRLFSCGSFGGIVM